MSKLTAAVLAVMLTALHASGQTSTTPPTIQVVQDAPATTTPMPSSVYYGPTKVGLIRFRTGTTTRITIDDADFFVHQHYLDFLSRLPDTGGHGYWTSQITACGSDPSCIQAKRVDVSNAFFHSIEFQETGYFAHRLHRVGVGRAPRMNELMSDARALGSGVIVGQAGWFEALEANKAAYAEAWVSRQEFAAAHAGQTNAQYVDSLIANAGVALAQSSRDGWVWALDAGAKTRGRVLREIAEDGTFANGPESNRAFVLMQYFGYLRRNPDDPPDTNMDGYHFWLNELNSGRTDRWHMVRAFIESIEYRERQF